MKIELSTGQAADILYADKNANWTYPGARALIEYLEDLEQDTEQEYSLDIVALRCEYTQCNSLRAWADDYGTSETVELENDEEIRDYIQERGQLIEFDGGIIVSEF